MLQHLRQGKELRWICLLCLALSSVACSKQTVRVRVYQPETGQEDCFFREAIYKIALDAKEKKIRVCPEAAVIYHPPTGCDPKRPHQVRWVLHCAEGSTCREEGDLIVIRPKEPGKKGDYPCQSWQEAGDASLCTQTMPPMPALTRQAKDMSYTQRYTMFNAEASANFTIPAGHDEAVSGIPNPKFDPAGSLGWSYEIEWQRNGKVIACVDPDIWIEKDGGGG